MKKFLTTFTCTLFLLGQIIPSCSISATGIENNQNIDNANDDLTKEVIYDENHSEDYDNSVMEVTISREASNSSFGIESTNEQTNIQLTFSDENNNDYSFAAEGIFYKLDHYGVCQDKLVFKSDNPSLLHCSIDLNELTIEIVILVNNSVKVFDIDLEQNYNFIDVNSEGRIQHDYETCIYYAKLDLDEIETDEEYDNFINIAQSFFWNDKYNSESKDISFEDNMTYRRGLKSISTSSLSYEGKDKAVDAAKNVINYYFNESCIKDVGHYVGTTYDSRDKVCGFYAVETHYDSLYNMYYSLIAVWDITYTIIPNSDKTGIEAIATLEKAYNLYTEYYSDNTAVTVKEPGDSSTYLITRNFSTMFKITGSYNNAYITQYSFYSTIGGSSSSSPSEYILDKLLGKVISYSSKLSSLYDAISDLCGVIDNYNYNKTKKAYEIYNGSNYGGYTRAVASTYDGLLYKRFSKLQARSLVTDLPTYARSMDFQIEYDLVCTLITNDMHHNSVVRTQSISLVNP